MIAFRRSLAVSAHGAGNQYPVDRMDTPDASDSSAARRAWPDRRLWEIQPLRDLSVIAIAVGLVWLGRTLSVITVPLLIALFLSYILEPVIHRLVRRGRFTRSAAAMVVILAVGILIVTPLGVVIVFGVIQGIDFAQRLPEYIQRASDSILPMLGVGTDEMQVATEQLRAWIEANLGAIARNAASGGVSVVEYVVRLLGSIIRFGLLFFLIPFFFFFFSTAYPAVLRFGHQLIPAAHRERWTSLIRRMDAIVSAFVRGQLVIAAVLGVVHAVGWLIIGVPAAILLGLLAGVLSLAPYVIGVTLPVAIGLLWIDQRGSEDQMSLLWILLGPTIVYLVAQLLEGYVLQPIVHGKSTNLDAATIVAAVIAGASIGGIYGALLAIPVTACLKIVVTDIVWPRVHDWIEGRAADPLPIRERS